MSAAQGRSLGKTSGQGRAFPGGPVAKTLCSQCRGPGSISGQGTRSYVSQLLHAATKDPACHN